MKQVLPNLYLLRHEAVAKPTPFTFLARRPTGNLLFATKADISGFFSEIEKQGGVSAILLGDRHHVSADTVVLARHFNVPLTCSRVEAKVLQAKGFEIGNPLPFTAQSLTEDLQIIPLPGHTQGAFAYLWSNEGQKILFIGDTLVPVDQGWQYWVSPPSRKKLAESLRLLKDIAFDHIVSNSFACTGNPCRKVGAADRNALLDQAISSLLKG
ncbi:hypothetical protein [Pseudomonas sessilinigenes]|uniref:Metallo-beta-lactamase domain-containing protein n=1 Tax=Pseudomonas sessilinigenes TaxID=658629 RepID=A0ABX8MXL4_9PSED|nr:hypothetical protein [Pseudomonas sessilinigenes]AZC24456.1 hypothetical protein C4K39_2782 [Pseudomonas sessilinigenes]QXH43392.1 hypothetical protein KSS89_14595 [Pseudomonas sessilinigenes]